VRSLDTVAAATAHRAPRPAELGIAAGDLWVFGYGSLMWDPCFPYVRWAPALIYGYHRALCISSNRWRGTPERPGLVLGLDRGGACRGIAFLVARADVEPALDALWAREMVRRVYRPRLLHARLPDEDIRALAFIADAKHAAYAGRLSIEETAQRVAICCGARGPNLVYLARTIEHLSELGVHDHHLARVLATSRALAAARDAT
jgi:glutathione-specific gamma-glutamylcyclotransferase